MDHARRDYIRSLYQELTSLGEEAGKRASPVTESSLRRAAAGPGIQASPVTPTVLAGARDPPRTTAAAPPPAAPKVVQFPSRQKPAAPPPRPPAAVPVSTRHPLPYGNPVIACGAAVMAIWRHGGAFIFIGALFAVIMGQGSIAAVQANIKAGTIARDELVTQLIFVVLCSYVLGLWIRNARTDVGKPFSLRMTAGDIATAVAITAVVSALANRIITEDQFALELRSLVFFAKLWPLHGPYASMATGRPDLPLYDLPAAATLLEPFAYSAAMVPALFLMPLILWEHQNAVASWFIFVLRMPLVIFAIVVGTLPIAILNDNIADWTRRLAATGDQTLPMIVLSAIFYLQIAMTGAIIGETYRRMMNRVP